MRAWADLPYARRAAEILFGNDALAAELARLAALAGSELRKAHFAARYRSIDTLLGELGASCVLELAAGLSFRSLELTKRAAVTYIDTDLPDMIATKQRLVSELQAGPLAGDLRLAPLDALDHKEMRALLPAGPCAIVNEGLLMYLDDHEKRRLASGIRDALARGGVWITADVYVRGPRDPRIEQDERMRSFLTEHRVEANKFESLAAAEAFFTSSGFAIQRRLAEPTRETWLLTPA
jgi:O-methyltransferase involved in polyketide biosynthesis